MRNYHMTRRDSQPFHVKPMRRGPNLFEVMSKAPVSPVVRRAAIVPWRRAKPSAPAIPVAQPLTEAEANAAIAQQRAAAEQRRLAEQARRDAKIAAKEAAKAAKLAAREARARARTIALTSSMPPVEGILRPNTPKPLFALNTASFIAVVGLVAAITLGAYTIGKQSANRSAKLPPAAALGQLPMGSPLLPNASIEPSPSNSSPAAPKPAQAEMPNDLRQLLEQPPARAISANKPARMEEAPPAAGPAENLNYLQIESFLITRERSGDQVAADVAHARHFLHSRGISTFARKRSNGYVLFAQQGFAPAKDQKPKRDAFIRQIQLLGREYRKSGGLYQFKGCLFVSHQATKAGDPV